MSGKSCPVCGVVHDLSQTCPPLLTSPGTQRSREIIAFQEARFAGKGDHELIHHARDLFDECAVLCNSIDANVGNREAFNNAYRLSGDARAALEVVARRLMKRDAV
jgi:hypothetical protein